MLQIRTGVFETNSSSTHSICIAKNKGIGSLKLPKKIYFRHGEFGWENRIIKTAEEKASYLYQAICDNYDKKEKERIINKLYCNLIEYRVESEFETDEVDRYGFAVGYIDHSDDLKKWVEAVMSNRKRLIQYLFSEESFVHTGNDNEERDVSIHVSYRHEEYYKGN